MSFPENDAAVLAAARNPDNGWGYGGKGSWTEPTAFAILALPKHSGAAASGAGWLERTRRADGGWAPAPTVEQSTWVTALAVLALAKMERLAAGDPAVPWLMRQTGRESRLATRLRQWMMGAKPDLDLTRQGWPWYPGASAWVVPTALTVVALEAFTRRYPLPAAAKRIAEGRSFLLSRVCADGGWNHGSARALGYEAGSYPETTGAALLALRGVSGTSLAGPLARAEEHWRTCRLEDGANWLRLGLAAHGRAPAESPARGARPRSPLDLALGLLADRACGGDHALFV